MPLARWRSLRATKALDSDVLLVRDAVVPLQQLLNCNKYNALSLRWDLILKPLQTVNMYLTVSGSEWWAHYVMFSLVWTGWQLVLFINQDSTTLMSICRQLVGWSEHTHTVLLSTFRFELYKLKIIPMPFYAFLFFGWSICLSLNSCECNTTTTFCSVSAFAWVGTVNCELPDRRILKNSQYGL